MSKQQYLTERIQELARLIRSSPSTDINRKGAQDGEFVTSQELDKLARMLRPAGNVNEHANAVRLRLRQTILNHPSAGSEGPLMLSKFDKGCENIRKLSPHILNSFLTFLKPVSFYEGAMIKQNVGQSKKAFPNVFQVDEQLHNDHKTAADPNSKPATFVQPLPTQANLASTENAKVAPNSQNSVTMSTHWIDPELERKLLVDIVYVLQGVTGKYIKYDIRSESYIIDPALQLSTTIRDMILCICELGWLFNRINEYLKRVFQQDGATTTTQNTALSSFSSSDLIPPKGLIIQAFGYALQEQLHDYYRLLAILEQELLKSSTKMPTTDFYLQNQTVADQQYQVVLSSIPSSYRDKAYESKSNEQEPLSMNYGLTILRLKAWMQEPIERMCLLARLVDSVQHLSGGALISRLYAHSKHGDQLALTLVQRILDSVCNPLYSMLNRWILHGELNDPYGEFFIGKNAHFNLTNPIHNLWQDLYMLRSNLLPSFITQSMAEKLLIIGKSIDFMKLCLQRIPPSTQKSKNKKLHTASGIRKSYRQINKMKKLTTHGRVVDQDDIDHGEDGTSAASTALVTTTHLHAHHAFKGRQEEALKLHIIENPQDILQSIYSVLQKYYLQLQQSSSTHHAYDHHQGFPSIEDILQIFLTHYHTHSTHSSCTPTQLTFATCISELSTVIDTQLVHLLMNTFQLKAHLLALKKFLLLGQGDFIICFMDAIGPELKKRANQLFRHNLLSILEGSLRASNAQYESNDILERISVRLLESKPGDTGWEIFSLDYIVDLPLNVVVHQQAMNQYRIAFHMLWRLKRVEWSLSITWKQFLSFSHAYYDYFHYASVLQRASSAPPPTSSSMFANILSQTNNKSHHQSTTVYQFSIELRSIFHYCNLNRAHMMHVVNNLCAFLMFEVMETTWIQLETKLQSAKCLNDIILAHDEYLQAILDRSLLSPTHETLNLQLQTLLQIILRFCQLEETLVADAMSCITRHKMFGREKGKDGDDESVSSNMTGLNSRPGAKYTGGFNPSTPIDGIPAIMISRITETVREYHTQFEIFMNMLKQEGEKFGEILRFLAFRLDFNSYHENQKANANVTVAVLGSLPEHPPATPVSNTIPNRAPSNVLASGSSASSARFSSSTTAERDALLAKYASKVGVSAASITSATSSSNRMYKSTIPSDKSGTAGNPNTSTSAKNSTNGPYK